VLACGACSYSGRNFVAAPNATRLPACLDVSIQRITDPAATGPVLAFAIANRCEHRVPVDFARMAVEGRDAAGASIAVAAQDPRHEIRPGTLVARFAISENIEFRAASDADDARLAQLCVDPAPLEGGTGQWICVPARVP